MFDAKELFKERLGEHLKRLNRYLRYIFNGHFMVALIFIIITISVYYQQWLEQMSPSFPAALVIAIVFGGVASYNPIQSFLKTPDKVFLTVKEEKLQPYFRLSLVYNYVFQLYMVLIVSAAFGPMFEKAFPNKSLKDYFVLIFILLLLKGWNMATNWYMFKVQHSLIRRLDKIIRTFLSVAIFFFLLKGTIFVITMIVLYFAIALNNLFLTRKQSGLAWETMIDNDQIRLASFYRFVSMFAEVPHLSNRLVKRRILSKMVYKKVAFTQQATFDFLYRLAFIRSSEYLSMYIRLTILGGIVIYFIPNLWLKLAFVLLFLYMTSFQMIALFHHYRTNIWIDLYPIGREDRVRAFITFLSRITLIQSALFALVFLILMQYVYVFSAFVVGILFNYVFTYLYVKQKLRTT